MAKIKQSRRLRRPARKQRAPPVVEPAHDVLDEHAAKAARMYFDPCGADLAPSVYPGDRGYVNRWTSALTAGGATGETCCMQIFKPGVNVMAGSGNAVPTADITVGYADTQAPGAAYLNTNASKARCLGACFQVRPVASPNACTGQIYFGVIPASSLPNGLTGTTYNGLFALLSQSVSASQALMQPLEIKWSPGAFDDRYSPVTSVIEDDDTDRNIIVVLGIGLPPGTGLHIKTTAIYEWAPARSVFTTIDSTSINPSKCDFNCVLRNLKRKDPEWWFSLGKKVLKGARDVTLGYYTGGPIGATTALAKYL